MRGQGRFIDSGGGAAGGIYTFVRRCGGEVTEDGIPRQRHSVRGDWVG